MEPKKLFHNLYDHGLGKILCVNVLVQIHAIKLWVTYLPNHNFGDKFISFLKSSCDVNLGLKLMLI